MRVSDDDSILSFSEIGPTLIPGGDATSGNFPEISLQYIRFIWYSLKTRFNKYLAIFFKCGSYE